MPEQVLLTILYQFRYRIVTEHILLMILYQFQGGAVQGLQLLMSVLAVTINIILFGKALNVSLLYNKTKKNIELILFIVNLIINCYNKKSLFLCLSNDL